MTEHNSETSSLDKSKSKQRLKIFGVIDTSNNLINIVSYLLNQPDENQNTIDISGQWDELNNCKIFKCSFEGCKRSFREKGNLRTHNRVHTGERPFKCTFEGCKRSFITMGNLKSHLSNHTGEKPYVCSFPNCGRKYSRTCRLKIHLRTHGGERPFKCTFSGCTKRFNEKGNLKTHLRIHSGEKPYICTYEGCGQSFKAHGHLKDHVKRHYNIKPYICDICGSRFARTSTLKIHVRTHSGEKPHACPYEGCSKKFTEKGNMKTHFKTHYDNPEAKVENFNTNVTESKQSHLKINNYYASNLNTTSVQDKVEEVTNKLVDFLEEKSSQIFNSLNLPTVPSTQINSNNLINILQLLHSLKTTNNFLLNSQQAYNLGNNFPFSLAYCHAMLNNSRGYFNLDGCINILNSQILLNSLQQRKK